MYWTPAIEVENAQGIREVALETRHRMNRNLFLTGEVDDEMANRFVQELLFLEQISTAPINIYINSPGGSVISGLVIYDAIQGSNLMINMICTGIAASMAAIILAGGQKGRRYILNHSKVMIHEPAMYGNTGGTATSIKHMADSILDTKQMVNELLAAHTGKTVEEIDKATSYDNYMNSRQSVEFGICDKVINGLSVL